VLLPHEWKAVAFVDMDVIFDSASWASDALGLLLSTSWPVVGQLHSHVVDMDANENAMALYQGCAYLTTYNKRSVHGGPQYQHPGMTMMMNRAAFEKMGIYEYGIVGSGDYLSFSSIKGEAALSFPKNMTQGFKDSVLDFERKARGVLVLYVPGTIRHFYHGSKENRRYISRNDIMERYTYAPGRHLVRDNSGLLQPSAFCPSNLVADMSEYFKERKEDD
jgi:hypothetical protein